MARPINVAIIGVGNCASSLMQGIAYYKNQKKSGERIPGIMHEALGGYRIADINIVAAFDVDEQKVGKDLADAVGAPPNNTMIFSRVPRTGVKVERGNTLDGIGKYLAGTIRESKKRAVNVAHILRERKVNVVVNFLPVGSERATRWYVEQALKAGCGFVNCIPVFIAREKPWQQRFKKRGLPIVGDDIKSQVGATIVHRALAKLMEDRGAIIDRTYQLNFGGNTDFLNMLERERLDSKKESKTNAVRAEIVDDIAPDDIHVGPSDYVPWLKDRKWCHIRIEGRLFGNAPVQLEIKLEVWDSPNSAGVVVDAIRCCKLAKDRGIGGAVEAPSAYFMKSPPVQHTDHEARRMLEDFIAGR